MADVIEWVRFVVSDLAFEENVGNDSAGFAAGFKRCIRNRPLSPRVDGEHERS